MNLNRSRTRVGLSVFVMGILALPACSSAAKRDSSSRIAARSQNPLLCPTDEGLTKCGLGPTNPPPKAVGNYHLATFAGDGTHGIVDGPATSASFGEPVGIAVQSDGSILVADAGSSRIRMIAKNGTVSTFAGTTRGYADGPVASAKFSGPRGIAIASDGTVFVADTGNDVIRAISGGVVSTYAGVPKKRGRANGPAASATFNAPWGLALDRAGNLLVTDFDGNDVRLVTTAKIVRLFAGTGKKGFLNGKAKAAKITSPAGIVITSTGSVFICGSADNRIRKIAKGVVSTFAGSATAGFKDGRGASALFNAPFGLAADQRGNLYLTEYANNAVRTIDPSGTVTTIVTSNGLTPATSNGVSAGLDLPIGIAIGADGSIYVSDAGNDVVRVLKKG